MNLALFLISFFLGGAGAWAIANYGMKLSLLDKPNSRSSHEAVTPKGGGIGILAAFFVCSIILSIPKSFWIPAVFLSLLSLWGDRSEIRPKIRLLFQLAVGTFFLIGIITEKGSGFTMHALMPFLLVFIVGTTNFYNFMDGINGIAGITGIIGFGLVAFYAFYSGYSSALSVLAICISISCIGFLPFNVTKARVFMGDVGSILLGFVFSGIVVYLAKDVLDFFCLMSFILPFYSDELSTMAIRLKNKESLTTAHRRHLYQILANEYDIAHWKISIGYGFFQLIIGISIFWVKKLGLVKVVSVLMLYGCLFTICSIIFRKKIRNIYSHE
jgi:Fuc2NAc and GlcNAc transferase